MANLLLVPADHLRHSAGCVRCAGFKPRRRRRVRPRQLAAGHEGLAAIPPGCATCRRPRRATPRSGVEGARRWRADRRPLDGPVASLNRAQGIRCSVTGSAPSRTCPGAVRAPAVGRRRRRAAKPPGSYQPLRIAGSAMANRSPPCRQSSADRPVILATYALVSCGSDERPASQSLTRCEPAL